MKVLGLDMSSQKSGYAFFVNGKLKDYGLWELDHSDESDWRQRIAFMANCVNKYCRGRAVDVIYVEDVPPIMENTQTVKVLSALQGMLIAVATQHDIEIKFIPVKTWKQKIGINLVSSKENNECKKRIKENFGKDAKKKLDKVKGWTKAWEKKLSVDYANHLFGLDLVYKSPTSKFNQDDISDAINIAWSQMGNVEPYSLETFEDIMDNFYDLVISE